MRRHNQALITAGAVVGFFTGVIDNWRRVKFALGEVYAWRNDPTWSPWSRVLMGWLPTMLPFALIATGFIWNHFDRRREANARKGTPLKASSWIERRLVALEFDAEAVHERVTGCVARLHYGGIETQEAAERFFADTRTLHDLRFDVYPHDLRRTESQLDPIGYCLWGPGLHCCPDEETRGKHLANLKEIISDMAKQGER